MTEIEASVRYRIQLDAYPVDESWDDVLERIRGRVPSIAQYLASHKDDEVVVLPKDFDQDQALRLKELLYSCGLRVQVISQLPEVASFAPGQNAGTNGPLHAEWSRFLLFEDFPHALQEPVRACTWGLSFRILGALLSVPATWLYFGSYDAGVLGVAGYGLVSYLADIFLLWVGLRLFAGSTRIGAVSIEAAAAPLSLLDMVPFVGIFVGGVWRILLRIHAISGLQQVAVHRALLVVLLPWVTVLGLLALLAFSVFNATI